MSAGSKMAIVAWVITAAGSLSLYLNARIHRTANWTHQPDTPTGRRHAKDRHQRLQSHASWKCASAGLGGNAGGALSVAAFRGSALSGKGDDALPELSSRGGMLRAGTMAAATTLERRYFSFISMANSRLCRRAHRNERTRREQRGTPTPRLHSQHGNDAPDTAGDVAQGGSQSAARK